MKEFFQDIFEYHHHFNQKVANLLIDNMNQISERSIPLFSHMMNAHQIWNSRILGTKSLGVNDEHTLEECKELDKTNLLHSMKILADFDLNMDLKYQTSRGDEFQNKVRDMLFQAANHHTHHRGQIISDLRQNGIVPIMTDYILYKR